MVILPGLISCLQANKFVEIGLPILPRFFLVTTQSGVKSMSLSLDGVRESMINPVLAVVDCPNAVWTYKYNNGYTVALRGSLTTHILATPMPNTPRYLLRFEDFQFDANFHDINIPLELVLDTNMAEPSAPWVQNDPSLINVSIPGNPVNAFGIPQATMRCLEVSSICNQCAIEFL